MDFKNANELLALCEEKNLPISEIMRIREIELGETASEIVNKKMKRVLGIMKDAAFSPIRQPAKSMGGLIGGEARKLSLHAQEKKLKFSYMEQKEWETIEDDIAALEEAIADLEQQMQDSARDYTALNGIIKEKEEKEALLEEKMDRWMYLNDLAEKIEAQAAAHK